jgi:hypothetical protein
MGSEFCRLSFGVVIQSVRFAAVVAGEKNLENAHLALTGDLAERFGQRQGDKFKFLGE